MTKTASLDENSFHTGCCIMDGLIKFHLALSIRKSKNEQH